MFNFSRIYIGDKNILTNNAIKVEGDHMLEHIECCSSKKFYIGLFTG